MNLPAPLLKLLQALPEAPPTFAIVTTLNVLRKTLWPEEDFAWWEGRQLRIEAADLNCGIKLSVRHGRFVLGLTPADVTFSANLADYWLIARRIEDPDTLFFQRRLCIRGDTELGLTLKNLMDATDFAPLLRFFPKPVREALHF